MARNMSHNIDSHVLSDLATTGDGNSKFYLYLQQRMDFLARISTEWPAWTMPLYLNSEILYQFISQKILLDRIASSENLKGEDICFFLNGKKIGNGTIGNGIDDFWVDIPEGPVGMHAFYSIMENFIRNSAKHGNFDSGKQLYIYLEIEDTTKDYYKIKLWDNVSNGGESGVNTFVENIKRKLEKGKLVKDTGELEGENLGIKEMAICAAFLQRCKSEELHKVSLSSFLEAGQSTDKTLMYTFQLKKPKLILTIDKETELRENNPRLGIYFSKDLNREIKNGINHQFLVIKNIDNLMDTVTLIKKYLHELPARIIIVTKDNNVLKEIEGEKLARRIRVINNFPNYPSDNNDNSWKDFILKVYEKWIRKIGDIEEKGKISTILFLRRENEDSMVKKWKNIKEGLTNDNFVDLEVFNTTSTSIGDDLWKPILKKISSSQKVVVLDNHGKIKEKVNSKIDEKQNGDLKKIIQLQVIGGNESLTLFNLIQNIPSGFPAKLFLFKIIESALFRILIVDERVAGATFNESASSFFRPECKRYNLKLIGCETATVAKTDRVSLPLSKKIEEAFNAPNSAKSFDVQRTIDFDNMKMEVGESSDQFLNKVEKIWTTEKELNSYDIILIHQGVIDKLEIEGTSEAWINKIRESIPYVFVDSGRGKPENLPKNVKYIEYSTIGQFVIQEPSKFHLISALFSIGGKERKDE